MKGCMLAAIGLFLGALFGGVIGVGLGLLWTRVFHTSDFEGYSGMLVFTGFMPAGIIIGRCWAPPALAISPRAPRRHETRRAGRARPRTARPAPAPSKLPGKAATMRRVEPRRWVIMDEYNHYLRRRRSVLAAAQWNVAFH
jgi:hypothetical protein